MKNMMFGAMWVLVALAISTLVWGHELTVERLLQNAAFWGIFWLVIVGFEAIDRHYEGR